MRRRLLLVASVLLIAVLAYGVATSSPIRPLTLSRDQAIARAATDPGAAAWTDVESKLLTYAEWNEIQPMTFGLGYVDETDQSALVWVVAYRARRTPPSAPFCEWTLDAFSADTRVPNDWKGSVCGAGEWPSAFDTHVDRSWLRLDVLRGD